MIDPRVGRGLFATFHAQYWFARWPLDHVFHDPCFRLARLEVLPEFGSDHFAVWLAWFISQTPPTNRKPRPQKRMTARMRHNASRKEAPRPGKPAQRQHRL